MGKGAKIAIGCFAVLLLAGLGVGVAVIGGVWWAKGKAEQYGGQITKSASDLARYTKEANANPFTRPADGAFTEDRLLKFLEVRKAVYQVYETHRSDFETIKAKQQAGIGDFLKLGSLVADIKMAQEKTQAEVGMSDGEYLFMVQAIYAAAIQSSILKETGKTATQNVDDALEQARRAVADAARQTGASGVTDKQLADAQAQAAEASKTLKASLSAPQSNIDLYRKHEDEIKKYTMEGLGLIGL